MILKNNAHPRGIDMGPARVPYHSTSARLHWTTGGLRDRDSGPEVTEDATKAERQRRRKGDSCPICGTTGLNSNGNRSCIKLVGPYLSPKPETSGGWKGWRDHLAVMGGNVLP